MTAFDWINVFAVLAVTANICAIGSGWGALFSNPGLVCQGTQQWFNLSPAYLCYVILMITTSLATYLGFLLALWFLQPAIHASNSTVGLVFMIYHFLTGIGATTVHVLVARVAGPLLASEAKGVEGGSAKGAVLAA